SPDPRPRRRRSRAAGPLTWQGLRAPPLSHAKEAPRMNGSPLSRFGTGWLLVLPFLALVVALFLGPIVNILWLSVTDPAPGLGNYAALFISDNLAGILWTTVRICVITTAFSVVFGYSIAYAMVHVAQRRR